MYHGNVNVNLENLENGRKCNPNQKWNNDKCQCVLKNAKEYNACEKDYIWNTSVCICGNGE